ncbi:MAG: hypothetical protein IJA44_02045 [Clostridia bacterium]|nr:hypothetical protein [Clostridia bacterium]
MKKHDEAMGFDLGVHPETVIVREDAVKAEIEKMLKNLKEVGVDGEAYVNYQLKNSIDRYAFCFQMHGLTSKLLKALGK